MTQVLSLRLDERSPFRFTCVFKEDGVDVLTQYDLNAWRALDILADRVAASPDALVSIDVGGEILPVSDTFMTELSTAEGRHEIGHLLNRRAQPVFYAGEDTLMTSVGEVTYIPYGYKGVFPHPITGRPSGLARNRAGTSWLFKGDGFVESWLPMHTVKCRCVGILTTVLLEQPVEEFYITAPWNPHGATISKVALQALYDEYLSKVSKE